MTFPPSFRPQATTDDVRLRCREMLSKALKGDDPSSLPDGTVKAPEELAELVEDTIFKKFRNTDMKYKAHVRSRIFNLKDKKNPALRENVLTGVIQPEKLAIMTSEEMASDEVQVVQAKPYSNPFPVGQESAPVVHQSGHRRGAIGQGGGHEDGLA